MVQVEVGTHFEVAQERFKNRALLIAGIEGSGKSSQAVPLSRETGLAFISMGDIFRGLAKKRGVWGDKTREMFDKGGYFEDTGTLIDIMAFYSRGRRYDNGFILEGGLRTLREVERFEEVLERNGRESMSITVINLRIALWVAYNRLLRRHRYDDTHEGIQRRFYNYLNIYTLGPRMSLARSKWDFIQIQVPELGDEENEEAIDQSKKEITKHILSRI